MKKKIMIIGAGHEQVPAIVKARELGLEVVATDIDPHAPGVKFADCFENVSTNDSEANLRVAKKFAIDGIMTLGSETAVPVVAHIASRLNLNGISESTAFKATNKNAMRAAFTSCAVPTMASMPIQTVDQAEIFVKQHGYPVIIKPSDSSGQRGISKVDNSDALKSTLSAAIEYSMDGFAIIESFCEGPEINVTAVVNKGIVNFLSLSDRVTAASPYFGIAIQHISPPSVSSKMIDAIKVASTSAIKAIGLTDGVAYPQVIASESGPRIIEIAARIPGGHMREVALYTSGIDMIEFSIHQALGCSDPLGACQRQHKVNALSVKFITELDFKSDRRIVKNVTGVDSARDIPGVCFTRMHLAIGNQIPLLTSSAARFGAVIAKGSTRDEAIMRSAEAVKKIQVQFLS